MTTQELYRYLDQRIPGNLSCEWDNDGLQCCPEPDITVHRVLVVLDVTETAVDHAIGNGYDAIVSHHPMVFHPLRGITTEEPVGRKLIRLLRSGIAAMSFHTRLDAVAGGVNDTLAARLSLRDPVPFGENGEEMGRIGALETVTTPEAFAKAVKAALGAAAVEYSGTRPVYRVAVLGGGGSDDAEAAFRAGADTYLTGELKHHQLSEAPERGWNLLQAGHYDTEFPVCQTLRSWILEADPALTVDVLHTYPAKTL